MSRNKRGYKGWHGFIIFVSLVAVALVTVWTFLPTWLIAVVFVVELVYFAIFHW